MANLRTSRQEDAHQKRSQQVKIKLPRSDDPLYLQVKLHIKQQIDRGRWPVGTRVPTLRQLSQDLNIAYATIARAIRELVAEGFLEAKSGRGTHVASRRRKRLQTIGILGSVSYQTLLHTTRYYRQLLSLLQDAIIERGQTVVYSQWPQDKPLTSMFDGLHLADGLLLLGVDEIRLDEVAQVRRSGIPLVCLGDTIRPQDRLPAVHGANEADTRRAIELLVAEGHEYIAYSAGATLASTNGMKARLSGYRHAVQSTPQGYDRRYVLSGSVNEQVSRLVSLKPAPSALMIADGIREFESFYDRLKGTSLDPGKRLSICAYDDNLWHTLAPLGISYLSIEQALPQIAVTAVDGLLRMLEDDRYEIGYVEIPSLIVRVSEDGSRRGLSVSPTKDPNTVPEVHNRIS